MASWLCLMIYSLFSGNFYMASTSIAYIEVGYEMEGLYSFMWLTDFVFIIFWIYSWWISLFFFCMTLNSLALNIVLLFYESGFCYRCAIGLVKYGKSTRYQYKSSSYANTLASTHFNAQFTKTGSTSPNNQSTTLFIFFIILNCVGEILFSTSVKYTNDLNEQSLNSFSGSWIMYLYSLTFLKQFDNILKFSFASLNRLKLMYSPSTSFRSKSYPPFVSEYSLNAFYFSNRYFVRPILSVIYRLRSLLSNWATINEFFAYFFFSRGRLFIRSLKPVLLRTEMRL
jgi:hypothetical protein